MQIDCKVKVRSIKITNMKAVTSSIALVALVAFSGLVSTCYNPDNTYMLLEKYLDQRTGSGDSAANIIEVIKKLKDDEENFNSHGEGFRNLVVYILSLENVLDGADPESLCDYITIDSLYGLADAAANAGVMLIYPSRNMGPLTRLLSGPISNAHQCYPIFHEQWKNLDKANEQFVATFETLEFEYINSIVEFDDRFKRLIYRFSDTSDEIAAQDDLMLAELFRDVLLKGEENSGLGLMRWANTVKKVGNRLKMRLTEPCKKLLEARETYKILEPAVQVLAIDIIAHTGAPDMPRLAQTKNKIDSVPSYVICKALDDNPEGHFDEIVFLLLKKKRRSIA